MADVAFAPHELLSLRLIDVQPEYSEASACEELGEGQADVAESDDTGREGPRLSLLDEGVQMRTGDFRNHVLVPPSFDGGECETLDWRDYQQQRWVVIGACDINGYS
jgi:hypothetical protein